MKIKSIKIEKLYGKYDFDWNLRSDVNIIAGDNGSYKTTLLRIMAIAIKTIPVLTGDVAERFIEIADSSRNTATTVIPEGAQDAIRRMMERSKFDFHTPNHFSKSSCSSLLARMRPSGCSFLNLA